MDTDVTSQMQNVCSICMYQYDCATTFANIDFENDFPKLVTYFQINGKKLAQSEQICKKLSLGNLKILRIFKFSIIQHLKNLEF